MSKRREERIRHKDGKSLSFSKKNTDMVSYEDLLIAQYLDELRKTKGDGKKKREMPPPSPYSQRLPHSDYGLTVLTKRRPVSATFHARPPSGSRKPKMDAKFIADPTLWDPATPRSEKSANTAGSGKVRPFSAPVRKKGTYRPLSATSNLSWYYGRQGNSRGWSARSFYTMSGRKIKSQYRKQPLTIRVLAFKNGSRDTYCRVAAPSMKVFLEMCTEKLNLPFAARRVFLEEGVEIFEAEDIPTDGEVYVSCGEKYRDPYSSIKRNMIISNGAKWTLSGVLLPEEGRKKKTKARMSKRMRALVETNRVRIIVYRNGYATEPLEIVADLKNKDEFLVACTAKLGLTTCAKTFYDWEGNEITDLTETPILHDCLQPGSSPILGPLWVSIGEAFSPTGTVHYIKSILVIIKGRLKDAKRYRNQINYALTEEEREKVTITDILSMSEDELKSTLYMAEEEIDQLNDTLQELNAKMEAIKELQSQEEAEGSNYRMGHIKELDFEHRLVGRKGLRLKVYENGNSDYEQTFYFNLAFARKGIEGDPEFKEKLLQRMLDDLSTSRVMSNPLNPKIAPVARKIFDQYGNEIKEVMKLEYDQEIWVSFGENFIDPFTYCLQMYVEKAKCYTLMGETVVIREPLPVDDVKNRPSSSDWEASVGIPVYDYETVIDSMQESHIRDLMTMAQLDNRGCYLQAKNETDLVLYPELACHKKIRRGDKSLWPGEAQLWVITKSGYIRCKSLPQLCLGVSDMRVDMQVGGSTVSGYIVNLQKKSTGNMYQQWQFNPDATVTCTAHPGLVLTYNNNKLFNDDSNQKPAGVSSGVQVYLLVTEKLTDKKDISCQRFALKQEKFENLGQWKHNDSTNPEWNKQALSWPDYDWPMEGYILPHAPKLHKGDKKQALSGMAPLRLMAVRNGERDERLAMPVVGPNLTNMMKDMNKEKSGKNKNKKQQSKLVEKDIPVPQTDNVEVDTNLHSVDLTVRTLEFCMFLDHCTSLLDLPFAARRLFDSKGNEHFSLVSLRRDDLVYISCGEPWMDPKVSKSEQQRRILLSQLSQDVAKIRQYCSLRNPEKYVMEIESNLVANTRMVINRQWNQDEEDLQYVPVVSDKASVSTRKSTGFDEDDIGAMTAHELSHQRAEQRLNNLKWPWERLVNVSQNLDDEDPEAHKYTDREMYEKYKPQPVPKISRDSLQRFVYEDGYIACRANRTLVLGVLEQEGRVNQVMLVKRRPDDINQRWVMKENGEIRSKHGSQSVLTIAMPANEPFAEDEEGRPLTFSGCAVTLQARKTNTYGKAHQKWRYDAETGYIHAFYTNPYDKEITAANRADVCTYSISGESKIDQPGYLAEIPASTTSSKRGVREITVCTSCARAMRGRCKLNKLPDKVEFSCAMGEAKKLKLQQTGSFRVLNGKVDLSTHEADLTLQSWEDTLQQLREETSVRTIVKEINAAKTILNQCTHKLGLASAARYIFTEDATMILEVDDLINWAEDNYKSLMVDQLERLLSGKEERPPSPEEETEQEKTESRLHERGEGEGQDSPSEGLVQPTGPDGDNGDQEGAGQDSAEVDNQEAEKLRREREQILNQVQVPPIDVILRYPIEVWVSSGGEFFPPEKVETKMENRKKKRAFRAAVSLELDIEKHVLRQMKARRYEDMNPGEYKSTRSSKQPVIIENNWQEPTVEEQLKHDTVHKLETHLAEVKANQNEQIKSISINTNRRLYSQPDMKRVMVYPNGESVERALYVWGESIEEILECSTIKLNMWAQAKYLFDMEGNKIEKFCDINRDGLYCVSMGKPFTRPRGMYETVQIKANWSRARKQYGPGATDLVVKEIVNPKVNVDPFGPPELALPPASNSTTTTVITSSTTTTINQTGSVSTEPKS
ncbi:hypothetical protein FSP39_021266 [Pinctada imbricata]|uniref:Doublecortin domain-containing protein n=1 Tax=Pinctada imbricata TaxID=66713 RepID=A0AA88YEH7_PINIB|nr:hypothetical protein FSP39_021266 [Pinctada imbricata]